MAVTGIGGIFFRAADPSSLRAWYRDHFGIGTGEHGLWQQAAGPCVFAPFAKDTDYFPADRQWMINLRVDDLDGLLARLRAAEVPFTVDPTWNTPETGQFARLYDPEGNAVELWQPPEA